VTVSDGWITLDGAVAWRFQKSAAERAVRHLMGVRGVTNKIVVQPQAAPQQPTPQPPARPSEAHRERPVPTASVPQPAASSQAEAAPITVADWVVEAVAAALRRSATLQAREISVELEEGTVVLTGDVHSVSEREEAERTAWSARGVYQVQNCITITPWGHGPAEEWGY
jgi:osmotically-inducible protein OsmY